MRMLACAGGAGCIGAYQGAGDVDATVSDGGVIQPFGLGEAEEIVVGNVHCCGG